VEPRWGLCRSPVPKPPEARYIGYKQFAAVKCFSTQVCCRVRPPSPIPQKTLCICANPMTQHGRGRVGTSPCPSVATLLASDALHAQRYTVDTMAQYTEKSRQDIKFKRRPIRQLFLDLTRGQPAISCKGQTPGPIANTVLALLSYLFVSKSILTNILLQRITAK